jgi:hypothetical protein
VTAGLGDSRRSPRSELVPRYTAFVSIAVGLVLSLLLPNIAIAGQTGGRWLVPTASFFLRVLPVDIPSGNVQVVAIAVNVIYLGLAMLEFGLVLALVSFWTYPADDMNRWLYLMFMIAGLLITLSVPPVLAGYVWLQAADVPVTLGMAWLPAQLAGLGILVAGWRSRDRIDRTWFPARPELQ